MTRVAKLTQTRIERKLSLKGRLEVANAYIVGGVGVYCRLAVVPYPKKTLGRLECLLFRFLWKGKVPLVRKPICCQHPHAVVLGYRLWWCGATLWGFRNLQKYLYHCNDVDDDDDDNNENKRELMWASSMRHVLLQLISFTELQSRVKCRPRLSVLASGFYRELVEGMREGKQNLLCLLAVAWEAAWRSHLKSLKTSTFLSDQALLNFFKYHFKKKVKIERKVLILIVFIKRWGSTVAILLWLGESTLNKLF